MCGHHDAHHMIHVDDVSPQSRTNKSCRPSTRSAKSLIIISIFLFNFCPDGGGARRGNEIMTPRARVRGTQKRCVARSSRPGSLHALSMLHEDKERLARRKTIEGSDGVYGCVKAVSPLDEVCVVAGRVGGNVVGSLSAKENTSATHKICYMRGFEVDRQSDEAMGGPIPTTPRTRVGTSDAHLEQWFLDATEQANPRRQKLKI